MFKARGGVKGHLKMFKKTALLANVGFPNVEHILKKQKHSKRKVEIAADKKHLTLDVTLFHLLVT